jgi:hypothetical protein
MSNTPQPGYENLTPEELIWADHAAETGNSHGLKLWREKSKSRGPVRLSHREREEERRRRYDE